MQQFLHFALLKIKSFSAILDVSIPERNVTNIIKNLQHTATKFIMPLLASVSLLAFGCGNDAVNPEGTKGQNFSTDKYYKMILKARPGSAFRAVVMPDQNTPGSYSFGNDVNITDLGSPVSVVATTPSQFADIRFKMAYPDNMTQAPDNLQSPTGNMVVAKDTSKAIVQFFPPEGSKELLSFPEISFKGRDQYTENMHIVGLDIKTGGNALPLGGVSIKGGEVFVGQVNTGMNLQQYRAACQAATLQYSGVRALQLNKTGYSTTLVEVAKPE
ncbi:MAG: hypothetical protein U0X91_03155 [Spirosomataceae bacterium]